MIPFLCAGSIHAREIDRGPFTVAVKLLGIPGAVREKGKENEVSESVLYSNIKQETKVSISLQGDRFHCIGAVGTWQSGLNREGGLIRQVSL